MTPGVLASLWFVMPAWLHRGTYAGEARESTEVSTASAHSDLHPIAGRLLRSTPACGHLPKRLCLPGSRVILQALTEIPSRTPTPLITTDRARVSYRASGYFPVPFHTDFFSPPPPLPQALESPLDAFEADVLKEHPARCE